MASSASAIADALVAVLDALTDCEASKQSYNLDTATHRYTFVVRPAQGTNQGAHFGSGETMAYEQDITLKTECFVKDLGDPDEYMNAQWTVINTVITAVDDNTSMGSTCDMAFVERWEVPEVEAQVAGMAFQPIWFWVRCVTA